MSEPTTITPPDLMATRVASQVAGLKSVRPLHSGRRDGYPHSTFEIIGTAPVRNGLSCLSRQWNGTVRFYVACVKTNTSYAECRNAAESLKAGFVGWTVDGDQYRIRKVRVVDETDIVEAVDDQNNTIYVKSIDFSVKALKK